MILLGFRFDVNKKKLGEFIVSSVDWFFTTIGLILILVLFLVAFPILILDYYASGGREII